jgi:hypothetical protein
MGGSRAETLPLMVAGMLSDKVQAARARGRDGDGLAQQQVAHRFGVHGQQARSGIASSSGRGVTRAARCERPRRERATARAGSTHVLI